MHTISKQLHTYRKRSRQMAFMFCLDTLFIVLAILAIHLPWKYTSSFTSAFLLASLLSIFLTQRLAEHNLALARNLEEYLIHKNYGVSADKIRMFHRMLDENLFQYHFQPIIDAKTGDIFAYDALMRSNLDDSDLKPTEILNIATKENLLYEIEKHTLSNTLNMLRDFADTFKEKKLFIHSISNHQLSDEDFSRLQADFGIFFENIVFEVQEATRLDANEIHTLHKRCLDMHSGLALDNYGSGYSSESYLLSTNPDYVKIDSNILRLIHMDSQKQRLAADLIAIAKKNHIKIIAGGIESQEEFEYVMDLDVDYIQGYYTSKPNPVILDALPEDLRIKIKKISYKLSSENKVKKVYQTNGKTLVTPADISMDSYSDILINDEELLLKGRPDFEYKLSLIIPDNHTCHLTLDNIILCGIDKPSILLGRNCSVVLNLVGDNHILFDGIRVPESSELTINGDGNLTIKAEYTDHVGIGGTPAQTYGNITIASSGSIQVLCKGNISVGIGGGQNPSNSLIRLLSGSIYAETIGLKTVTIGSMSGNARIEIADCRLSIRSCGTKAVSIGSMKGFSDINTSGAIDLHCDAKYGIALGSLEEGNSRIKVASQTLRIYINTMKGAGLGSYEGNADIQILNGDISIHGEGNDMVGIGSHSGSCKTMLMDGLLSIRLCASNAFPVSTGNHSFIINGGNIQFSFPENYIPINSYGDSLTAYHLTATSEYTEMIETEAYQYQYHAITNDEHPDITVYLPNHINTKAYQLR